MPKYLPWATAVLVAIVAVLVACVWYVPGFTGETKDGEPYLLDDFLTPDSPMTGRPFLIEAEFVDRVGDEDEGTILCRPVAGSKRAGEVAFLVAFGHYAPFYRLAGGERIVVQARCRSAEGYQPFDECVFVRRAAR